MSIQKQIQQLTSDFYLKSITDWTPVKTYLTRSGRSVQEFYSMMFSQSVYIVDNTSVLIDKPEVSWAFKLEPRYKWSNPDTVLVHIYDQELGEQYPVADPIARLVSLPMGFNEVNPGYFENDTTTAVGVKRQLENIGLINETPEISTTWYYDVQGSSFVFVTDWFWDQNHEYESQQDQTLAGLLTKDFQYEYNNTYLYTGDDLVTAIRYIESYENFIRNRITLE